MNFGLVPDCSPLSYDEWWALCGLPDVRAEVERRTRELAARELQRQITEAWAGVERVARPALEQLAHTLTATYEAIKPIALAMAGAESASHAPPMWANNPTKTRRKR